MKKLLAMLLILIMLPLSALAEEQNPVTAFDFDLTCDLLWEAFPEEIREQIHGYADLLEKTRITGTAAFALGGNHSFDVQMTVSVTDRKTAFLPLHFFGNEEDHILYFSSPVINNERFYVEPHGLMVITTKMYDYFDFPFYDWILMLPGYWDVATAAVRESFARLVAEADPEGVISNDAVMKWAAGMAELYRENEPFEFLLKGIGVGADFDSGLRDELDGLENYVSALLGDGDMKIFFSDGVSGVSVGDHTVFDAEKDPEGKNRWHCELPTTPKYGYAFFFDGETAGDETKTDLQARIRIDGEEPGSVLDLTVRAEGFPKQLPFRNDFSLLVDMKGNLKGNGNTRMTGTVEGELCRLEVEHSFDGSADRQKVFTCDIRIAPRADIPAPEYGAETWLGSYYLLDQNETTLGELEARIAMPMIKTLLPILVETPASACKSIMDFLTEHGIIAFVTGHLDTEDVD